MIKLSIITPSYNAENHIKSCILNVANQLSQEIEHIIVDGGSADQTATILSDLAPSYPHIKWVSEKDKGQSHAMNKGIKMAKGEYISFLNVDDYYEENALATVLKLISDKNAPDFLVGNCKVWNEQNELMYINKPQKLKPWHILSGVSLPVNPSAYFYKKSIHDILGGYNENNHYNMDVEFIIQVSLTMKLIYYDSNWGNFRLLANTKTGKDIENNLLNKRKDELFNTYLCNVSWAIRVKTRFAKLTHKLKHSLIKLKKAVFLPFDMIYWKSVKIFNNRKQNK